MYGLPTIHSCFCQEKVKAKKYIDIYIYIKAKQAWKISDLFSNIDKTVCKACRNVDAFQNGTKEEASEKFLFLEMSEHKNQSKFEDLPIKNSILKFDWFLWRKKRLFKHGPIFSYILSDIQM